jgi:hypothetical protein
VDLAEKKVETVNEDLHVHISADTYEKIDAAIALLDLLMTPVDVSFNILYGLCMPNIGRSLINSALIGLVSWMFLIETLLLAFYFTGFVSHINCTCIWSE